jgi:peptide/nickel transport system permease protein
MKFYKHRLIILGIVVVVVLVFCAIFAPLLAPYDPFQQNLAQGLSNPSTAHWMGQDKLGRDIFSRILYGTRVSVMVGGITVLVSATLGILLGSLAGYFGGVIDEIIMRLVDILLAFPGILLAIAIMSVLGPSLANVILALCLIGWVGYARLVRGEVMSLRKREYITAAQAQGIGSNRIIFRHILPNILSPVIVQATFGLAGAIIAEAGLSFLGLGTQPPNPSWGAMLNEGRQFILVASHISIFPGIAIMMTVLGLNFLGDGLRDVLDPKSHRILPGG